MFTFYETDIVAIPVLIWVSAVVKNYICFLANTNWMLCKYKVVS